MDYDGNTFSSKGIGVDDDTAFYIESDDDVFWYLINDSDFTIEDYSLVDIPTIQISKVTVGGDILNVKDVYVDYVDPGGNQISEINRGTATQNNNKDYLITNTTHSVRYTTDSTYTSGGWRVGWLGVDYVSNSEKRGWHGTPHNNTQGGATKDYYAQIQFVNPNDTDNIITPRPWLITDENTTWGDTSFEDGQ